MSLNIGKVKNAKVFKIAISLLLLLSWGCFMVFEPYLTGGTVTLFRVLEKWQSLNAGLVALMAAYITISFQKEQERKKNKRVFDGVLYLMAGTLSSMRKNVQAALHVYIKQGVKVEELRELGRDNDIINQVLFQYYSDFELFEPLEKYDEDKIKSLVIHASESDGELEYIKQLVTRYKKLEAGYSFHHKAFKEKKGLDNFLIPYSVIECFTLLSYIEGMEPKPFVRKFELTLPLLDEYDFKNMLVPMKEFDEMPFNKLLLSCIEILNRKVV